MAFQSSVSLVGLQLGLMIIVLGFTSRDSVLRLGCLPLVTFCTYLELPFVRLIHNSITRAFVGAAGVYVNILYVDTVLLHKWTYKEGGPTSSLGGLNPVPLYNPEKRIKEQHSSFFDNTVDKLTFGADISLQSRFPATKWPIKNIPPFRSSDNNYVPTKGQFLRDSAVKISICICILDGISLAPKSDNAVIFSQGRISFFARLTEITREEFYTRIFSIIGYWAVQYIIIQAVYSSFAMVAIASGITPVQAWPPVFGSVKDSYSLRRFWGTFYHQLIRRGCGSIAYFITYATLRARKGGMIGRYLFIFCTFAVSGIFHMFSDMTQGLSLSQSGAMQFFCMQTLGIMLEDAITATAVRLGGTSQVLCKTGRCMGYVWVLAWLIWTTPVWTFPTMQRDEGKPILPFNLIRSFKTAL